MIDTIELTKKLIHLPSISPDDAGCQAILAEILTDNGFKVTPLRSGKVDNLWVEHGTDSPRLVFAGHTDVVATGPKKHWTYDPFTPTVDNNYLYGRGAQDMKGAVAAMVCACCHFVNQHPQHKGSIGLIITSGEEARHYLDGTPKVVEYLQAKNKPINWCVVGEPSSTKILGDTIRNGRRGSLKGFLTIHGQQGHVAYPHLADNPTHKALPVLDKLVQTQWDQPNGAFPATTLQISNIAAGTGALNVTPGEMSVYFSFRFSPALSFEKIEKQVRHILDSHQLNYSLDWELSGNPFYTDEGVLIQHTRQAIEDVMSITPCLSTAGGTSDGRFIAPTGAQVIELGTSNDLIHQINERVHLKELEDLTKIYTKIMQSLLT